MSTQMKQGEQIVSRDRLAELLNEDLAREYQAIIAYVVYSQVLKGAEYMNCAKSSKVHRRFHPRCTGVFIEGAHPFS